MDKLAAKTNKGHICRTLGITVILIALLAACAPARSTPNPPAYWPTAGWRSTTPEEQGMDSESLAQMVEHIQAENLPLHSLLIARNGYLVSELYPYPYSADQPHWIFSVTKSVIGTLIGIAIQQGYIKDVKQPLLSLLPEEDVAGLDQAKRAIKLEDVLTQSSGLDCADDPATGAPAAPADQSWVRFSLEKPLSAQPGTKFQYCTSTTHLLSAVLQQTTGMSAREFANKNLFAPLGFGPIDEARWPSDPQGVTLGGLGLALTPSEMAKLGYLFLNQGQWEGKTVVPADWVAASTARQADKGDKKEYGYLWWVDPQGKWYAALGLGGQHVFVFPAENLVVSFTSDLPLGNDADLIPLQELLDSYILPAVKSDGPLPADPEGQARLESAKKALAQPQLTEPSPLPDIAKQISGKTYTFEENPFGWNTMIFTFPEGWDEARITVNSIRQAPVGLDNAYRLFAVDNKVFPQAFRGRWESQDTFVLEGIVLGQTMQDQTVRAQFTQDGIHISVQAENWGSPVEVEGKLIPPSG